VNADSMSKVASGAAPALDPGAAPRVYVVDDDPDMRQTVVEILALSGVAAAGFESGTAAHAACAGAAPDLAVVDQRLPDTTGIALAGRLKSADPDLGVMLLTGYASADNAIAAVGVVDEFLTKPVPPDDLVRRVRSGLDRTRLRRENRQLVARLRELNSSLEATVAQRTRELEEAHRRALEQQVIRERLQAQAERERLENRLHQSQRLESLGQLAGGVAHDFNNLLAVILNCVGFVAEATVGDAQVRADIEQIRTAAERAAELTRKLLIFGHQERVRLEALDLNAVVADAAKLLARSIGEHIKLVVRAAPGLPPVRADRGQIEQVLVNLAVNARDAMPDGGTLAIEPSLAELDEEYARLNPSVTPGRYVALSVSDTGTGMSREVVGRVFEPFFTTKAQGKGTGLGLAIVHGIVTGAGGSVSVYSERGVGTTIRAYFPVASGEPAAPAPGPPAADVQGRGETILVVEDEPAVLDVAARILEQNRYTVLAAGTGSQALALAAEHRFDLLLTDMVMPEISGLELARRVKQLRPEVAVLFMSGYSQDVLGPQRVNDEGIALVQKPFSRRTLLDGVRTAVGATARPGRPVDLADGPDGARSPFDRQR
jgi:signal transduction histidine kinase